MPPSSRHPNLAGNGHHFSEQNADDPGPKRAQQYWKLRHAGVDER
jgi:hypothetical protein